MGESDRSGEYLIWSNQHGMWWRPDSKGYTCDMREAGRYSRDEAIEISRHRFGWAAFEIPKELPVLAEDAAALVAPPKAAE